MNRRLWPTASLAALFVALVGCNTVSVPRSERLPSADLASYETFALLPSPSRFAGMEPGAVLRFGEPMREACREALVEAGLTEGDLDSAGLAIRVSADARQEVDVQDWGYRYRPGHRLYGDPLGYRDITVTEVTRSRIVVEAFDRSTEELVWIGWLEFIGDLGRYQPADATAGVRQIVAQFAAERNPAPATDQ